MRPSKYPLDPLARLRSTQVDDATKALAASVRARESAATEREAAERQRDAHEAHAAAERRASIEALGRGELRAGDLAQKDAWEHRVQTEAEELARGVEGARSRERSACDAETRAQSTTANRKAESDAVSKDEARWQKERSSRAETRDEDAAAEAWGGKAKR